MKYKVRGRVIDYRLLITYKSWGGMYRDGKVYINLLLLWLFGLSVKCAMVHEETHRIIDMLFRYNSESIPKKLISDTFGIEEEEIIAEVVAIIIDGGQLCKKYLKRYGFNLMDSRKVEFIVDWAHYLLNKHWGIPVNREYVVWLLHPHIHGLTNKAITHICRTLPAMWVVE